MNSVLDAAAELQAFCDSKKWKFCFIGGLAVQRWGEPRNTRDADLTLMTGFEGVEAFVDDLLEKFPGRRADARAFALQYRVLLFPGCNGTPLDVTPGAMPFEERSIERSSLWTLNQNIQLRTCCAEDLAVHKVFAAERETGWTSKAFCTFSATASSSTRVETNSPLCSL
jgi:hypothetical protein